MRKELSLLSASICAASVACAGAARGDQAVNAVVLERLVRQDCGSCHGMTLKGGLGPALRGERLSRLSAEAIEAIILDGIPGSAMPPWRSLLKEGEARWIADYLLREAGQ